jgi:hypothetical protein
MTPTTASTDSASYKYDIDDSILSNEKMVTSLVTPTIPGIHDAKIWSGDGPAEPTEVVVRNSGPPDGGYGWVVVAYLILLRLVLMIGRLVC